MRVSTHAPRTGRDANVVHVCACCGGVSTHAPRAGRDAGALTVEVDSDMFQPTRPVRGATSGETGQRASAAVSTHAPRAGRDAISTGPSIGSMLKFQPTRPVRGATTGMAKRRPVPQRFNPRAPCGARRAAHATRRPPACRFNPRAPCGARHAQQHVICLHGRRFQPTRPVRGATRHHAHCAARERNVSTHAPRAGRDRTVRSDTSRCAGFNPRAQLISTIREPLGFNPRAPCGARLYGHRRGACVD